jgi:hypothetical protein
MNATHEALALTARASVPQHVLIQEIAGQSAILDIQADMYFGLDDVATEMWRAATNGATVAEAIESLSAVYDVEQDRLRTDTLALLGKLRDLGLLAFE